jgi:flagellar basal-body rod modification protein FlgD
MEISALTNPAVSQAAERSTGVSRDAFLQLLITQLRYQDPLSPMENEAFLAQLAQFSSLEQMQQLNENFANSMALAQSEANSSATGLIGRYVRASGDTVSLPEEGAVSLGYFLGAAGSAEITIYDSAGVAVRHMTLPESAAGSNAWTWDGRNDAGERLDAGEFTFTVEAHDANGEAVSAATTVVGKVEGITFQSGTAELLVNGRHVPLSSVLEVFLETPDD